jgi:hypothetical protein
MAEMVNALLEKTRVVKLLTAQHFALKSTFGFEVS